MIDLRLSVKNPFHKKNDFRSYFELSKKLSSHKVFEFQVMRYTWNILEIELDTHLSGKDHAGPSLLIGFFGLIASVKIYDTRHWDYDTNSWQK